MSISDEITIRQIRMADAKSFLALCLNLDHETKFMMLEPGERDMSRRDQKKQIEQILKSRNSNLFVAVRESEMVGYIMGLGGEYQRNFHKMHIITGILKDYSGQGLGKRLFKELETWAERNRITRLEMTVMTHNQNAIGLYEKMGFVREGEIRNSVRIDGAFVNEFLMAKIIDS